MSLLDGEFFSRTGWTYKIIEKSNEQSNHQKINLFKLSWILYYYFFKYFFKITFGIAMREKTTDKSNKSFYKSKGNLKLARNDKTR